MWKLNLPAWKMTKSRVFPFLNEIYSIEILNHSSSNCICRSRDYRIILEYDSVEVDENVHHFFIYRYFSAYRIELRPDNWLLSSLKRFINFRTTVNVEIPLDKDDGSERSFIIASVSVLKSHKEKRLPDIYIDRVAVINICIMAF